MSTKHLRLDPHPIPPTRIAKVGAAWWYEERKGILILLDLGHDDTAQVWIPWRELREAIKRRDRP